MGQALYAPFVSVQTYSFVVEDGQLVLLLDTDWCATDRSGEKSYLHSAYAGSSVFSIRVAEPRCQHDGAQ